MVTAEKPSVFELIPRVMADVGAIGKSLKNEQAGYAARAIDDVMNAVQSALIAHGVFYAPNVVSVAYDVVEVGKNRTLMRQVTATIRYTFYGPQGDSFDASVLCEALDSGDKSSSKAMSMALKYGLLQVLCVPTKDMRDADAETHERAPRRAPEPAGPLPFDPERFKAVCADKGVDPADVLAHAQIEKPLDEITPDEKPALLAALDALVAA